MGIIMLQYYRWEHAHSAIRQILIYCLYSKRLLHKYTRLHTQLCIFWLFTILSSPTVRPGLSGRS